MGHLERADAEFLRDAGTFYAPSTTACGSIPATPRAIYPTPKRT